MPKIPVWLTSQDSKLWLILGRSGTLFGIASPIIAIVVFVTTGTLAVPALIIAIYLCVMVTILLALLINQERRYVRDARYAPASLPMRHAFAEAAKASFGLYYGDESQVAFRLGLRESLRRFAEAFTLITGTQCRACIKVIQAPEGAIAGHDLLVSTLCRDNEDEDGSPSHKPDRISENTDFRQIFTENQPCFFSNDLIGQLSRGYKNSHWQEGDIQSGTLDYLATIVWPIERGPIVRLDPNRPREIIGFLCIDTRATGVFVKTYDVALGASFAQALYLALHRFREISAINAAQEEEGETNT